MDWILFAAAGLLLGLALFSTLRPELTRRGELVTIMMVSIVLLLLANLLRHRLIEMKYSTWPVYVSVGLGVGLVFVDAFLRHYRELRDYRARLKQTEDQRGFTLIELLIVMAIIGILVAIAIPALLHSKEWRAQQMKANTAAQAQREVNASLCSPVTYDNAPDTWSFHCESVGMFPGAFSKFRQSHPELANHGIVVIPHAFDNIGWVRYDVIFTPPRACQPNEKP